MESPGRTVNRINTEEALDDFDCPICQDVLKTPIRTKTCRHVFCRSCFRTAVGSQGPHCPLCRGPVSEREKKAEDVLRQMREKSGPCRACGSSILYSKMRSHYKYCKAYIEEYGPPVASRNVQRAQNGSAARPQTSPPVRISPALLVQHPSSLNGRVMATYCCPYCQQQGLSDMALVQHCTTTHTNDPTPVVCPICVATSWGEPNYHSQDFIGHLRARHRYSYDMYMNVHDDEDTQLHLAIQHSILQMSERRILA